jgi:serine phosphatase RsbU (regulator of sigma subunit)
MFDAHVAPAKPLPLAFSHDYRSPKDARLAGGDVVALSKHDDGTTALLVADISAKGAEGSGFARRLAALFAVSAAFIAQPSLVLEELNCVLYEMFTDRRRGLFAAAFVCRFLPAKHRLIYACAGTERPMLFGRTRLPRYLYCGGVVLGVHQHATYDDEVVAMDHDDTLIAYTDGVTESLRRSNSAPLGAGGVLEAILHSVDRIGYPDSHEILAQVDSLNGGRYHDDATVAAVGCTDGS